MSIHLNLKPVKGIFFYCAMIASWIHTATARYTLSSKDIPGQPLARVGHPLSSKVVKGVVTKQVLEVGIGITFKDKQ